MIVGLVLNRDFKYGNVAYIENGRPKVKNIYAGFAQMKEGNFVLLNNSFEIQEELSPELAGQFAKLKEIYG